MHRKGKETFLTCPAWKCTKLRSKFDDLTKLEQKLIKFNYQKSNKMSYFLSWPWILLQLYTFLTKIIMLTCMIYVYIQWFSYARGWQPYRHGIPPLASAIDTGLARPHHHCQAGPCPHPITAAGQGKPRTQSWRGRLGIFLQLYTSFPDVHSLIYNFSGPVLPWSCKHTAWTQQLFDRRSRTVPF